ncbi:acetate--CoA ligase family protein [Candidatus Woesearchaeota archaeon]|nr:acetate--CoA ligase family protein [Candidatus Woesearchaeota archaeon]MBW3016712.1 acetate--CoA ligase family protein [Candidatus Woesearchaeota archaeon]
MILTVDVSLDTLNIPVAKHELADSLKSVERFARGFGFPVVLKLVSPKVVHKTEVGGVVVVHSLDELRSVASKFLEKGKVLVQEYCSGVEMFLGIKNDPAFGHVILAGVGGIFVEVYRDVSCRVCPINSRDAENMLDELKGRALLEGIRGQKPVNKKALIDAMVKLSRLPEKMPDLEELDVNPFFIDDKGGMAADARFILSEKPKGL